MNGDRSLGTVVLDLVHVESVGDAHGNQNKEKESEKDSDEVESVSAHLSTGEGENGVFDRVHALSKHHMAHRVNR